MQPSNVKSTNPLISQLLPDQLRRSLLVLQPNHDSIPVTPIIPARPAAILGEHRFSSFLTFSFTHGFRIPHAPVQVHWSCCNHSSARAHSKFLLEYISAELAAGHIKGPFHHPPCDRFIASPLGGVPKKEQGSFRVIHDLSFPKKGAVNDLIPNSLTAVSYEDFEHVVSLINSQGPGALIAKVDIKSAFRILPIHPDCIHLFGFTLGGVYFMDKCLPMGCSLSCSLFEKFSTTLQEVLIQCFSFHCVSHILDDFIFLSPSGSKLCQQQLEIFLSIASFAGIPIETSKTLPPATVAPIHRIEVDTSVMTAHLSADKVHLLCQLLEHFQLKRSARLRQWQSLIGHLSFATRVIHPGHPFIRKFINKIKGHTNPNHHIKNNSELHHDAAMWLVFLREFNGISIITPLAANPCIRKQFFSDASGWGYAAMFGSKWFQAAWPSAWVNVHINVKEFVPIVIALQVWGQQWSNSRLQFFCDNQAVVEVFNRSSSKDPLMLALLRYLMLFSLRFKLIFTATHLPGRPNVIADHLSRSQASADFLMQHNLDLQQQAIPAEILDMIQLS